MIRIKCFRLSDNFTIYEADLSNAQEIIEWKNKLLNSFGDIGTYDFIEQDVTQEHLDIIDNRLQKKNAYRYLRNLQKAELTDLEECKKAIMKIIKAIT